MALRSIIDEVKKAQQGRYAVPLFDLFETLAVEGVFAALEEKRAPVIAAIYSNFVDRPNSEAFAAFVRTMAERAAVTVSTVWSPGC